MKRSQLFHLCHVIIMLAFLLISDNAFAQSSSPAAAPHGTCTTDPPFTIPPPSPGYGVISTVITGVQGILNSISSAMFLTIVSDDGFIDAIRGLLTIYIAFYGIMFTLGMVQLTLFDFLIRMIKIGVITILLSPDAWNFFNFYVVQFFNAGTDGWINRVSFAVLNVPGATLPSGPLPPFWVIDQALSKAISAKMAVTLMAMFFAPPYGPIFGLLLVLGLGTFVRAILTATWVYLMSLILKALLFGIAPIFLSFLLFVRTKHLFDGWLNQVISATLQPILLFTFLAFFVALLDVALDNVFLTPVCWTEWSESLRGSPFSIHYWRFALCNGANCEPYSGSWNFTGPQSGSGPIFPIDILGILVVVMLADLASRFNSIVAMIASDLAGAATNLATMQGAFGDWFKGSSGKEAGGDSNNAQKLLPAQRPVPGAAPDKNNNQNQQNANDLANNADKNAAQNATDNPNLKSPGVGHRE